RGRSGVRTRGLRAITDPRGLALRGGAAGVQKYGDEQNDGCLELNPSVILHSSASVRGYARSGPNPYAAAGDQDGSWSLRPGASVSTARDGSVEASGSTMGVCTRPSRRSP